MYGDASAEPVFRHLDRSLSVPIIAAAILFARIPLQRVLINRFIARPEHKQFILMLASPSS